MAPDMPVFLSLREHADGRAAWCVDAGRGVHGKERASCRFAARVFTTAIGGQRGDSRRDLDPGYMSSTELAVIVSGAVGNVGAVVEAGAWVAGQLGSRAGHVTDGCQNRGQAEA